MDIKTTTLFLKPYSLLEKWIGDFTNDIDNFLTDDYKKDDDSYKTYIMHTKSDKNILAIRFPGATRGHVSIDDNGIITSVVFYDETCFDIFKLYKKEVIEAINSKYIGTKIIFNK